MSRVKLVILSLLLVSFVFCTFGTSSYADKPTLQGPVLQGPVPPGPTLQGPVLQGPTLRGPTLSGPVLQGPTLGGPLELTPLEPVDPSFEPDTYSYEVFRATPGGIVFILKGYQLGERDNLLCVNRPIDIEDYEIENILVANRYGYATAEIVVPDNRFRSTLYMQALDARKCKISGVTEFE